MKKFIVLMVLLSFAVAAFSEQANKAYDPNKSLKNSLRLSGKLGGKPISKDKAKWVVLLPRETQVNLDSAIILPDTWAFVSEDERVVILFAGGLKEGNKVLDIRGK